MAVRHASLFGSNTVGQRPMTRRLHCASRRCETLFCMRVCVRDMLLVFPETFRPHILIHDKGHTFADCVPTLFLGSPQRTTATQSLHRSSTLGGTRVLYLDGCRASSIQIMSLSVAPAVFGKLDVVQRELNGTVIREWRSSVMCADGVGSRSGEDEHRQGEREGRHARDRRLMSEAVGAAVACACAPSAA